MIVKKWWFWVVIVIVLGAVGGLSENRGNKGSFQNKELFEYNGPEKSNISKLVDMVNENPTVYFCDFYDYYDLQYISSEYDAEKDAYFLYYQGKVASDDSVIRTYNLKAHFYRSNDEWVLHEVERELANTYLDIVGSCWKTTPTRYYSEQYDDYILLEDKINILDVTEDNEQITLMWGHEEIKFQRRPTENEGLSFVYTSIDRSEPVLLSYTLYSKKEPQILLYLGNKVNSGWGEMPDLAFQRY